MEDLTGWGASNIQAVGAALDAWPNIGFASGVQDDSPAKRGQSMLFLRHLIDRRGAQNANSAATLQAATNVLSELLSEETLGYQHSIFAQGGHEAIWHMNVGVYATGRDDLLSSAHARDFLPIATAATGQVIGLNTHLSYLDAHGEDVELNGPSTETLDALPEDLESEVVLSGAILFELSGLEAGEHTISARGDSGVDLHLAVMRVQ
ncbi:MAG: hypothetical protein R3C68_06440 [Myxococcota bacterium]